MAAPTRSPAGRRERAAILDTGGADAVCIGRPYCWGLAADGQAGVERALGLLQDEFERILRLAGTPIARTIGAESVAANR